MSATRAVSYNLYFRITFDYFLSVLLKRDGEHIIKEDYDDFNLMRINQKCISEMVPVPDDFVPCSASIFFKDNNYWIYHKN